MSRLTSGVTATEALLWGVLGRAREQTTPLHVGLYRVALERGRSVRTCRRTDNGTVHVWWADHGSEPLTLSDIAQLVAPMLWSAPDEPLWLNGHVLPQANRLMQERAVVYFQARSIRPKGDWRVDLVLPALDRIVRDPLG